jgi:hypothetical protein
MAGPEEFSSGTSQSIKQPPWLSWSRDTCRDTDTRTLNQPREPTEPKRFRFPIRFRLGRNGSDGISNSSNSHSSHGTRSLHHTWPVCVRSTENFLPFGSRLCVCRVESQHVNQQPVIDNPPDGVRSPPSCCCRRCCCCRCCCCGRYTG